MDADVFDVNRWTSGAQRSLARAAKVAQFQQATEIEPLHLLWALLMDEGRAGESLESAGVSARSLAELHAQLALTSLEDIEGLVANVPWGMASVTIAREALHYAFQMGVVDEAGSDHLLAALAHSDTDAGAFLKLRTQGLPVSESATVSEPLPDASELMSADVNLDLRERAVPNLAEVGRILDAAANRAREGFRVVEDYVRFGINDAHLSRLLKEGRHELASILADFPHTGWLRCRDTQGDVGTSIETRREYQRTDLHDVLTAACKRVEEALRTLEEYGKIVSGDISRRIERLRYRVYTLEKAILQTSFSREQLADQQLYLLLTDSACPGGVIVVLRAALEAGVRMFQVREKALGDRELLEHCRRLRRWTRERDALLIINDRPDIAVLADADGVHVGQEELAVADARRIVGPDRLIGVSIHSIEQARQAVLDGADYLGVGPTFASRTKSFGTFPGLDFVRAVANEIALPWFAIGGINEENIDAVIAAGAMRVAVTEAVSGSDSPVETAATLMRSLRR